MRKGCFDTGEKTLRAKIDVNHPNILMRDPVMYRIVKKDHYRLKDKWCIYPRYDFSHCLCDYTEGVTHSLCGKEFEVHSGLYNWFLDASEVSEPPRQIEYAELNISGTILGKRHIRKLIGDRVISGWDDPRLLTLQGLKRRGYTPEIFRAFFTSIGISRVHSRIPVSMLENSAWEILNKTAPRRMAVIKPVKLIITNYPENEIEYFDAVNNPENPESGTRKVPFSRELYIEGDDFSADPPPKFFRMAPGREVRLKYAYIIVCTGWKADESGAVKEVYAEYYPETKGGNAHIGRKIRGTIHWVSVPHAEKAAAKLFSPLTENENPLDALAEGWTDEIIDPESEIAIDQIFTEPGILNESGPVQFERLGYFIRDEMGTDPEKKCFNRITALKSRW